MIFKCYTYSILVTLYITVSTQTDVNEATDPFTVSQRFKRNPDYEWEWQYWPEEQQTGIGPPVDQYNVFNHKNYNDFNQFAVSSSFSNQDPLNYDQTQSKRHLEVKREPHLPFDYIPDYTTPVQNILKNIPGYNWVQTNNPGSTYTQVIEGGQNPLRDIFNVVFGPEQTDRILQTGQSTPNTESQATYQNHYYNNNNYHYPNSDYENNRQQVNDVQIQPSVTEVIGDNSANVYNTQYHTPYNNNQQQVYSTFQHQFGGAQQTTFSSQTQPSNIQPIYSQSSSTQQSQSYNPQLTQQNVPIQMEQRPNPSYETQFNSVQIQSTYPASDLQQTGYSVQSQSVNAPPPANTIQENSQQSAASGLRGQETTTTLKPIYTRPPIMPSRNPQKTTGQATKTQKIGQQASPPVVLTSTPYPVTQIVMNSVNPPYTNVKVDTTTRRVLTYPTTQQTVTDSKTTTRPYVTSTKFIEENQVTENISTNNDDDNQQGVNFRKDALELYGTKIQNISYAALPNQTIKTKPLNSEDEKKINKSTTNSPVQIENRFSLNSASPDKVPTTTRKPIKKCDTLASRPVPNFNTSGRRISQIKCYEYIWEQQERVAKWNAKKECHSAQKETIYIAGREAIPAQYPHMAALGWSGKNGAWLFKCGGALVSPKFVLTTGHCSRTSPSDISVIHSVPQIVRLGDRDVAERIRIGTISVDVGIKRIIAHPEYTPPKQYYDIALIELQKDIIFTRHVQPACLWSNPDTSKLGNQFIATGWGLVDTAFENNPPPALQTVAVNSIDANTCNGLIKSYCNRNWCGVADNQICGTSLNGSLDACQGDSGAPLQTKIPLSSDSEGSMHYVIGVTSFRTGCGQANLPTVYTRVSSFINWIENIVWMSNS